MKGHFQSEVIVRLHITHELCILHSGCQMFYVVALFLCQLWLEPMATIAG